MRTRITILVKSSAAGAILCALAFCSCSKQERPTISAIEAKDHILEKATVRGTVYEVRRVKSGNTVLFIDGDNPNHPFAVVSSKAGIPYETLKHFESLTVCVTGTIRTNLQGKPQIAVNSLNQISTQTGPK
jgi:DNA/RNA endonuclease YhcR with UshA esterase domain